MTHLYSKEFPCNVGVRQRENLSLLLFYLNNSADFSSSEYSRKLIFMCGCLLKNKQNQMYFKLFPAVLYADDTVIRAETVNFIQNALRRTVEYSRL